jgi:quinol monooxygenase YgiN
VIVVTARAQIPTDHRERFIAVATEMCTASRADDGCHGYRFYADLEQPNHYLILEEWEDDAALQAHFGRPHTTRFLAELTAILAAPVDALFHTVESTRRLDPARGLVQLD